MSQNKDIKALWNRREVEIPNIQELYQKTKNYKMQKMKVLLLANLIAIMICSFIAFVWIYFQPQFITTKLGIVVIIASIVINLMAGNRMLPLLLKADQQTSNSEYLRHLLKIKERQKFLLHTCLNIYFITLSAGLFLYMYEYTSRMTLLWGSVTYAILIFWIAFNWLYLRPRSIRKQESKLNDLILKFQSVNSQLE